MKKNNLPDVNSSKPILVSILAMAAVILVIAQFSGMANSQDIQIISAKQGDWITYQGHGSPGSQDSSLRDTVRTFRFAAER